MSKQVDAGLGGGFQKVAVVDASGVLPTQYNFMVTITNTNPVPVYVTSLTDQFPSSGPVVSLAGPCGPLPFFLPPGGTLTCLFSESASAIPPIPNTFAEDIFRAKVARGATPSGGGGGGVACADPDPSKCIPPCLDSPAPPTTTTTMVMLPCVGAIEEGEGFDTARIEFTQPPPPPPLSDRVDLRIDKTNDADGDGTFSQSESTPNSGAPVPFRIVVTNLSTSTVALTTQSVTDSNIPSLVTLCPGLVGVTLQPGDTVSCTFTVAAYSPPAGGNKTNLVTLVANACGFFDGLTFVTCKPFTAVAHSDVHTIPSTTTSTSTTSTSTTSTSTSTTSTTTTIPSSTTTSTSTTRTTMSGVDTTTTMATTPTTTVGPNDGNPGPIPPEPQPQPPTQSAQFQALAFTGGSNVGWQLLLGAAAVTLGLLLVVLGRRRSEPGAT